MNHFTVIVYCYLCFLMPVLCLPMNQEAHNSGVEIENTTTSAVTVTEDVSAFIKPTADTQTPPNKSKTNIELQMIISKDETKGK